MTVLEEKYKSLVDKYGDVFDILGLGLGVDANGNPSSVLNDRQGTFFNGAIRTYDTAQFFIPAEVDEDDEKRMEKGMDVDNADDGNNANNAVDGVPIIVNYKNKQFSLAEIKAMAEFIDERGYDMQ